MKLLRLRRWTRIVLKGNAPPALKDTLGVVTTLERTMTFLVNKFISKCWRKFFGLFQAL